MIRNILANLSFDANASVQLQGMYFIHSLCKHSAKNSQYCAVVLVYCDRFTVEALVHGWREGGGRETEPSTVMMSDRGAGQSEEGLKLLMLSEGAALRLSHL